MSIAVRERSSHLGWLLVALTVLAFAAFGVPSRMLSQWTYAMERGKLQASSEELAHVTAEIANLEKVSHAFGLVAKVAGPGVVHIRVSRDETAHARIVELNREHAELSEQLERAGQQVRSGSDRQPSAEDLIELYARLRDITEEIESLSERLVGGSGSGIVFDEEGYILTNNHVVEGRGNVRVILPDDREYEATLVGRDPKSDLAVVKIDATGIHALSFGDSDQMEVGDWVIAVGAPFGLPQTVTHGIVSATGRDDVYLDRGIMYRHFLQTDAEINPGNSGGPLLNLRGEVIGVNTAIATNGDGYNAGIAFTIPSNMAVKVAKQLRESGKVARGWLGITLSELGDDDVQVFELENRRGVLVDAILAGSPAKRAGLRCEDIIVAVGGRSTPSIPAVQRAVADLPPGETAELTVLRDGRKESVPVKLGLQPDDLRVVARGNRSTIARALEPLALYARSMRAGLARTIMRNSGQDELALLAAQYEDQRGIFVCGFDESSEIDRPDIEPGELIVAINDEPVHSVTDLAKALGSAWTDKTLKFDVVQPDGGRRAVEYRPK